MFDKWRKYSYVAQKERRLHVLRILIWVFVFFIVFVIIGSLFISTVVMENSTMEPGIHKGDRFVVSPFPYGARIPIFSFRLPGPETPQRGDLVIVERIPFKVTNVNRFLDAFIRFFSGQRVALYGTASSSRLLKRVVGVPGDTISMVDHVVRVKPSGDSYGLTEFELTTHTYDVVIPKLPEGWNSELPFSGSMDIIVLGHGEYFLMSDDRSCSNDSRVWGPVSIDSVIGKVLFRYWPVPRFGHP